MARGSGRRRNAGRRPGVAPDVRRPDSIRSEERDDAFQTFVVPEVEVLYRVAMRLTGDPHGAEDLVQETLLRAYRGISSFDGAYPRAWLLTILRNTNVNRTRRRRPELLFDQDRTLATLVADGSEGRDAPAEAALARIPDPTLVDALRRLSTDHLAAVVLVDIDGLSYREAADLLDVPVGTVMSRLHRARNKLRAQLERAGHLKGAHE